MFRLLWVTIRPYYLGNLGSVPKRAWRWLKAVETWSHEVVFYILHNKLLCFDWYLYTLWGKLPPNSCLTCWGEEGEFVSTCHSITERRERIPEFFWRWSQVMRWLFMGMAQEPSDSPLALHLKWSKTSFPRFEEHAYYLFITLRAVCYELVPQGQNVNQHYHMWHLMATGGHVAIGFCTIAVQLLVVLCLFMNYWLETKSHFMCTFLYHRNTPAYCTLSVHELLAWNKMSFYVHLSPKI
jgi:hypothetical protein